MASNLTPEEMARYVDEATALSRVRGNKGLYKRMLGLFLNSEEFAALDAALDAGDLARAGDVAHAIKGMTGNLALTALFEVSTQMMQTLREGTLDEALVAEYRDTLAKTRACVEAVQARED